MDPEAAEPQQEGPEKGNDIPWGAVTVGSAVPCELTAPKPLSFSFQTPAAANTPVMAGVPEDAGADLTNDRAVKSDSEPPGIESFSVGIAERDFNLKSLIAGTSWPAEFEAFRVLENHAAVKPQQSFPQEASSAAKPPSLGAAPHAESAWLEGLIESSPLSGNTPVVIQGSLQKRAAGDLTDRQDVLQPTPAIFRSASDHAVADLPVDSRAARVEFTAQKEQLRTGAAAPQASEGRIPSQLPSTEPRELGLPTTRSAIFTSRPENSAGESKPEIITPNESTTPKDSAGVAEESLPTFSPGNRRARESGDDSSLTDRPELDAGQQATTHAQRPAFTPAPGSSASTNSRLTHEDPPPARGIAESAQARHLTTEPASQPESPGTRTPLRQLTVRLESGTGSRLDVQFTEARGSVDVKLRTHSDLVANALLGEVSQLESELNSRGWRAELSAPRSTSEVLQGKEDHDRYSGTLRTGTVRGGTFQGGTGQVPLNSEHGSDSPKRQRDWSSDEQELSDMAALRRLAIKGEPK